MTIQTRPAHVVRDDVGLPEGDAPVLAGAERRDLYPIHVVSGPDALLDRLAGVLDGAAVALITDETVEALYGGDLLRGLRERDVDVLVATIPAGEASKSLDRAVTLWDWLAGSPIARRDVVVNLGGGVVCDLGGWVASAYMRGLPYVNLPTTLLAQVDGALGGKVAVNHPLAKNLLGAFHQPEAVIAGIEFLDSTGDRELSAGLAEAIKKAVIASPAYWRFIDAHAERLRAREPRALIGRDPYERDLRRPLNFGHAVGHALETVTGYGPLLHGEAVAYGMVVETELAVRRGLAPEALLEDLMSLLRRCGLPASAAELRQAAAPDELLGALEKIRLIRGGSLRIVLPIALGETAIADDIGERELREALDATQ